MAKKQQQQKKGKDKGGLSDTRKPKHSKDANRPSKMGGFMRDAATVRRLNMYNTRPVRNKYGHLIREDLQSKELPSTRIQPDRRWFGNTRVVGQKQLEQFRAEMITKVNDAYTVLLREKKLPLQLLEDPEKKTGGKQARANLLATQPFQETYGPKGTRKRPKLAVDSLEELVQHAANKEEGFELPVPGDDTFKDAASHKIFDKGQSKRIWGELYKVLDSSDVIIEVLDARDPNGTRCRFLEQHVRKHLRHKHIILLLNKVDLVPAWVTKRWLHHLSREFPTLAFHASITNPFGKGSLLSLLRQLARLRSDKQAICVGFVGYPNVGKSSVINTLRMKKVCKAAPVPGETKIWQYITLMKRILLIDCPGVVYNRTSDSETDTVLKGVVRIENLEDPEDHVTQVLQRVKPEYLKRAYKLKEWGDSEDFLTQVAKNCGKLLKGGDADLKTAARMVLLDWQRGKIPFFNLPPDYLEEAPEKADAGADTTEGAAAELPVPAEAVTEEDAVQEAGARPEDAAAAARVVREVMGQATALQARMAIPVQQGYFLPADEKGGDGEDEGDEGLQEDPDIVSDSDEDDDEGENDSEADDEEAEEEEEELQDMPKRGRQVPSRATEVKSIKSDVKKADKKQKNAEAEDSGDDSDGYGQEGLSWEAVLQSIQGGSSEPANKNSNDKDAEPGRKRGRGKKDGKTDAAEPALSRKQKKQAAKKAGSSMKTLE